MTAFEYCFGRRTAAAALALLPGAAVCQSLTGVPALFHNPPCSCTEFGQLWSQEKQWAGFVRPDSAAYASDMLLKASSASWRWRARHKLVSEHCANTQHKHRTDYTSSEEPHLGWRTEVRVPLQAEVPERSFNLQRLQTGQIWASIAHSCSTTVAYPDAPSLVQRSGTRLPRKTNASHSGPPPPGRRPDSRQAQYAVALRIRSSCLAVAKGPSLHLERRA